MKVYLSNNLSLQMLDIKNATRLIIHYPTKLKNIKALIKDNNFISAIWHEDLANILSNLLGLPVKVNRISIELTPNDTLIIAQYHGSKLPEGATTLPQGAKIYFYPVTVAMG